MKFSEFKQYTPSHGISSINKESLSRATLENLDFAENEHNIDGASEYTDDMNWKAGYPSFAARGVGTVFLAFDKTGEAIRVGSSKSLNGRFATFKYGRGRGRTQEAEVLTWKEAASLVVIYMKKPSTAKHLETFLREKYTFKYNVKKSAA